MKVTIGDFFCGLGGLTEGAEQACKELGVKADVLAANHWPVAIESHSRNHVEVRHRCVPVESLLPTVEFPEGVVTLLMGGPSCQPHSKAKAKQWQEDPRRADPWHFIPWMTNADTRNLLIENVPQFVHMGPRNDAGDVIEETKGMYFQAWVAAIKALGYSVDWRIVCCADYGDATERKRFFLIARKDGKPIVWPKQTHSKPGPDGKPSVPGTLPWVGASTVIDYDDLGRDIFDVGLSEKSMMRAIAGFWKDGDESVREAMQATPNIAAVIGKMTLKVKSTPCGSKAGRLAIFTANFGEAHDQYPRYRSVDEPMWTVTGRGAGNLVQMVVEGGQAKVYYREPRIDELARGMSFPPGYWVGGTVTEQKQQVGNSVPVKTAKAMVKCVLGQELGL